ncbi:MAG TPA: ABC transporter ATP-binding protein [Streptosporangiaceae bacterium]|nr:ABC transporter ATP-binding protein [Streptosporangiaceae bacterium]
MTSVIRCEGLTKRYRGVTALDGLDLDVGPGQVFGFLGPNGAGKTTTLRILLGLVTPTAGRAWVNGRPAGDPDGLARIGAMIEEPAFYPWLTGRRNLEVLALSGPPLPGPAGQIGRVLAAAGLGAAADRKVKGYSQGMRQRLGLAAALMREPSLLLLDEPANGMDPAGIAEFRTLLRSLAGRGITVFLSSHLLAEVEQICDQVAVLRSGRLVEQGPMAGLATARARVRVVLDPADKRAALALLAPWAARPDGPDAVLVDQADGQAVTRALGQSGIWPHQVVPHRPALEEAFLTMTEGTTAVNDATASR